MGFLSRLRQAAGAAAPHLRASPNDPRYSLDEAATFLGLAGGGTGAGVSVTPASALGIPSVYACVRIISETLAGLPVMIVERGKTSHEAVDHPVSILMGEEPNPEQISFTMRDTVTAWTLLWGNGYIEIVRDESGKPRELWPLKSIDVDPFRTGRGELMYRVSSQTGQRILLRRDIMHLQGLNFDGLRGLSPIGLARESIGVAVAAEQYGGRFFGQASLPSGVLEHPGKLDSANAKRLRTEWEQFHRGMDNAHRVAVLESGAAYKAIGIPPEDSQFLQTRQHGIADVARLYRVPLHKLQELQKSTFRNVEQLAIEFVTEAITPWMLRWEQEATRKLLSTKERKTLKVKLNLNSLLRGDTKGRGEFYRLLLIMGVVTPDEVRALEDFPPHKDKRGEIPMIQGAMMQLPTPEEGRTLMARAHLLGMTTANGSPSETRSDEGNEDDPGTESEE